MLWQENMLLCIVVKMLYIDRFELQKQKFIEARNKYLAEIKGTKRRRNRRKMIRSR